MGLDRGGDIVVVSGDVISSSQPAQSCDDEGVAVLGRVKRTIEGFLKSLGGEHLPTLCVSGISPFCRRCRFRQTLSVA